MADLSRGPNAKNPPAASSMSKLGQFARMQISNKKDQVREGKQAAGVLEECVGWLLTAGELHKAFSNVLKLRQNACDLRS